MNLKTHLAEIDLMSRAHRDYDLALLVRALPPGYLAAMAEVAEAADKYAGNRALGRYRVGRDLIAALARLRELEPKKEWNG